MTRKKKIQSSVWRVRDKLRPEKKRYSRLSVGYAVLAITTEKKKRYSRLSGELCCMLCQFLVLTGNWQFFCCDGKFSLRPEKKKIQSSVWRVRNQLRPEKKRYSRLSVGCPVLGITRKKKIHYDRKEKKIQSSV